MAAAALLGSLALVCSFALVCPLTLFGTFALIGALTFVGALTSISALGIGRLSRANACRITALSASVIRSRSDVKQLVLDGMFGRSASVRRAASRMRGRGRRSSRTLGHQRFDLIDGIEHVRHRVYRRRSSRIGMLVDSVIRRSP